MVWLSWTGLTVFTAAFAVVALGEEEDCVASEASGEWPQSSSLQLWNGVLMPRVGFGTAAMHGEESKRSVHAALDAGFRHFDGAEATEWYDDAAVGEAVEEYVKAGKGKRADIFLVSKVHPKNLGTENTRRAIENMLVTLRTDYLDLVLIHFPTCGSWIPACQNREIEGTWEDSWRVMEEYYEKGTLRSIGVSNFDAGELAYAIENMKVKPHVIQNWMDPLHQDLEVRDLCAKHNIAYTSYSTLGAQWEYRSPRRNLIRENPTILSIAEQNSISWAQVALKWALQSNAIVLPRSTVIPHIQNNAQLLSPSCERLSTSDMKIINDLPPGE